MLSPLEIDLWAGLGSTIVGGLLAALTVVLGVVLAQRYSDQRARSADRRKAGDQLIIEVSNLRDAACRSVAGRTNGEYDLWLLRTRLYITQTALRGFPSYKETWDFYEAVSELRAWVRAHIASARSEAEEQAFEAYRRALDRYGDRLIEMLQVSLEDRAASIEGRRSLPVLGP